MKLLNVCGLTIACLIALSNYAVASTTKEPPLGDEHTSGIQLLGEREPKVSPPIVPEVFSPDVTSPSLLANFEGITKAVKGKRIEGWMNEPSPRIIVMPARLAQNARYHGLVVLYAF